MYKRSFVPFVRRLLERPELGRYVQKVELKCWSTLEILNPWLKIDTEKFDYRPAAALPSADDYALFTEAARSAGIIQHIWPYEPTSSLIEEARAIHADSHASELEPGMWENYIYDSQIDIDDIPYDRKFCQLLNAGIEDSYVALMLALLPHVRELVIYAAPCDHNALPWRIPRHGFATLTEFVACAPDGYMQ
jgi:hypothetical protein